MLSPLRHARLDADLTLFDMQQRTGIPMSRLSMFERLLVEPRASDREALARVLGRSVMELFGPPAEHTDETEGGVTPHLERGVKALERHGCRPKLVRESRFRAHCPGLCHRVGDLRPSLGVLLALDDDVGIDRVAPRTVRIALDNTHGTLRLARLTGRWAAKK